MRTEKEMLNLVLEVAEADNRVRAVGMNGSRINPNILKDPFQDYDIVFIVTDVQSFIEDPDWINVFGERIIMQTPEKMSLIPPEVDGNFPYLMLFSDGNRIDLTLCPVEKSVTWNSGDQLAKILLDKDHALPELPPPTDIDYWVRKPSAKFFADCCNEFWWVSTYVAKGLWRKEVFYAYHHLNVIREMLMKMIEWKVGIETNFSLSIGKNGKYLNRYLDEETWTKLITTYPKAEYEQMWSSLFKMTNLFEQTSTDVADRLQFEYSFKDAEKVKKYLEHVHKLPSKAKEIY